MLHREETVIPVDFFSGLDLVSRQNRLANHSSIDDIPLSSASEKKIGKWRKEIPWSDENAFSKRLAADGLDETSFKQLLSAPLQLLADLGTIPQWIQIIQACYNHSEPAPEIPLSGEFASHQMRPFLFLAAPLIERAIDSLRKTWGPLQEEYHTKGIHPCSLEATIHSLLPHLTGRLLNMMSKTMVLELHVAKLRQELVGDNPKDRFESFTNMFKDRQRSYELFKEYPVLAHQLVTSVEHWQKFVGEFLTHLHQDWEEIVASLFNGSEPGPLVACDTSAGDGHREGKSVILLTLRIRRTACLQTEITRYRPTFLPIIGMVKPTWNPSSICNAFPLRAGSLWLGSIYQSQNMSIKSRVSTLLSAPRRLSGPALCS